MLIIGCDLHTRYQQIEAMNTVTGEVIERRLDHVGDQVEQFYSALPRPVRVGVEATGYSDWFEQLLKKCGHELWVGDAARIRGGWHTLSPVFVGRCRWVPHPFDV